jgi:tetratricopeptide (TPR) repeat protein
MSGFFGKIVEELVKEGAKAIGKKLDESHKESVNSFNIGVNYYNKGFRLLEEATKKNSNEIYKEAAQNLKQSIPYLENCENIIPVYMNLSICLSNLGNNEEAVRYADLALQSRYINNEKYSKDKACLYYVKAIHFTASGKTELALNFLKRAVSLDTYYKQNAKQDEDFKTIRNTKEFKEIVD